MDFTAATTFEVPAGITQLYIQAWGARGGHATNCDGMLEDDGGLGGYAAGMFAVTPGDILYITPGGIGGDASGGYVGGANGGGSGGEYGAGGGGGSDVRLGADTLDSRIVVGGGGGGGNAGCPDHGIGGAGGGDLGDAGSGLDQGYLPGGGGTQIAGGTAGDNGAAGAFGVGASTQDYHFAGGGGGYYGGGSAFASGGGGGSGYVSPDALEATLITGGNADAGLVTLSVTAPI